MEKYYVYAMRSFKDGRIYVGLTSNLIRRLREHNNGQTTSTKFWRPWKMIYKKSVSNRIEARIVEKKLKSGYGKEFLKQSIIPR